MKKMMEMKTTKGKFEEEKPKQVDRLGSKS